MFMRVQDGMNSNTSVGQLIQMVVSLGWRDILILHDHRIDTDFLPRLDMYNITHANYDITYSTDEHLLTVLIETHHLTLPVLNLLLLCDHVLAVRVLKQMETFDAVSSFPFDIRHSSRVLMVGNWSGLDSVVTRHTLVENIAVVEMPDIQNNRKIPMMWTLIFTRNGRVFSPVSLTTWPTLELSSVFPNTQYGYNGRQLKVVMKHYQFPHGHVTVRNMVVSGISYRILEYMAQDLNFSHHVVYPREDEWGRDINGSWTGIVGMLQRKEVDLAAEPLTINDVREAVADHLLPPITENKMVIVYKMTEKEGTLEVYLHPFHTVVYIALSGALLMYSLLLCFERLFHKIRPKRDINTKEYPNNTLMQMRNIYYNKDARIQFVGQIFLTFLVAFQEGLMASLRQGVPKPATRASERFLVSCWWLFTILISSVYCGAILSSFTVRIQKPPFSNLGELAERQDYTIGYDSSTVIDTYLQASNRSDAILLWNRVREEAVSDPDVLSSDLNKHYDRILQGKYAFLDNDISVQYKIRTNCMLKAVDFKFGDTYFSFAVPKNSPFRKAFERSMYSLQDNGVLQEINNNWLRSVPEKRCAVSKSHQSISLEQLQSIFIAVGMGICGAAVVLLVEKIWAKVISLVAPDKLSSCGKPPFLKTDINL